MQAISHWHEGVNPFVELPAAAEHLWLWFVELDGARSGNGFAALPIGFGEIDAWARLTGRSPRPWEVQALRHMDNHRLELAALDAQINRREIDVTPRPEVSERTMTPELFDAVFKGRE